jgi:hypothetical protein
MFLSALTVSGYAADNGRSKSTSKESFETFSVVQLSLFYRRISLKRKLRRHIVRARQRTTAAASTTAAETEGRVTGQRVTSEVER